MKCDKEMMLLYAVTDRTWTKNQTLYEQVESAISGGVTCVQLREKNLDDEKFLIEALEIRELCKKNRVPFIINDNVDVAIKCKADGIHIGQDDMNLKKVRQTVGENMIIGVSVHNVEQAREAVVNGADYLGLGAVFNTSTKTDVDNMPFEMIKAICEASDVPTVAIGGICIDNISKLSGSGIDGVAVVSAIFGAQDIELATRDLLNAAKSMVNF